MMINEKGALSGRKVYQELMKSFCRPVIERGLVDNGMHSAIPTFDSEGLTASRIYEEDALETDGFDEGEISKTGGIDFRVGDLFESECVYAIRSLGDLDRLRRAGKIIKVEARNGKFILESDKRGRKVYYGVSAQRMKVPEHLDIIFDSKSTTARLGILCDNVSGNDFYSRGLEPFIASVRPYAFRVEIEQGKNCLHQGILVFRGSPTMSHKELLESKCISLRRGSTSLNLGEREWLDGYGVKMTYATDAFLVARQDAEKLEPIPLSAKAGSIPIKEYFDVREGNGEFEISPGEFVLGATEETISLKGAWGLLSRHVPRTITGLLPHLAGFINPYWGGTITTEMRSETRVCITRGMDAMYVQFHKLLDLHEEPKTGEGSYMLQKTPIPQPPKMFEAYNA